MANYNTLKNAIQDVIKTNGNKEITGQVLQDSLIAMINSLGSGYQFIGVATPQTTPGTPDQNVFYIGGAGTYSNFGTAIEIPQGSLCVFAYNGGWVKNTISIVNVINDLITGGANNVLSAEQGKKLNNAFYFYGVKPLKELAPMNIFISGDTSSPANKVVSGSNYKSYIFPIKDTDVVQIQNATGVILYYCWLSSDELIINEGAPCVTAAGQGNRLTIGSTTGDLTTITPRTGTKYLYFGKSNAVSIIEKLLINGKDVWNNTTCDNIEVLVNQNHEECANNYSKSIAYSDRIITDLPDNYLFFLKPIMGLRYNSSGNVVPNADATKYVGTPKMIAPFDMTIEVSSDCNVDKYLYDVDDNSFEEKVSSATSITKGEYFTLGFYVRSGQSTELTDKTIYTKFIINKVENSNYNWLALGDSLTFGVYSYKNPDVASGYYVNNEDGGGHSAGLSTTDATKTYVARLQKLLGYKLTNKGIGGMGWVQRSSSSNREWNLKEQLSISDPQTEEEIRFYVDAADYDLITIFLGVNDWKQPDQQELAPQATLDAVEANMKWCFDKLISENQNIKIIVFSPVNCATGISSNPPSKVGTSWAMNYDQFYNGYTMNELVARMKLVCESYGIEFHDMLHNSIINVANIGGNDTLLPDNVHPSLDGHRLIAEDMFRFIGGVI